MFLAASERGRAWEEAFRRLDPAFDALRGLIEYGLGFGRSQFFSKPQPRILVPHPEWMLITGGAQLEARQFATEPVRRGRFYERLPDLAAELVRLNVDVIVTGASQVTHAAQQATDTIPIVLLSGDPIDAGIVPSLARPGGNVTGVSTFVSGVMSKQLELLVREVAPGVSRVAVLQNPTNPTHATQLRDAQAGAQTLGAVAPGLPL